MEKKVEMAATWGQDRAQTLLNNFVEHIETTKRCFDDNYWEAIIALFACKGKIVTTGMGKGGLAMRKFSSTLCSFGISSCFLHPGEASHGDLGLIAPQDILFVASTSGKTREVIETVDLARKLNVSEIIGITSHPDSPIRGKVDIVLDMGVIKEAGNIDMAPTTSILVMQVMTDIIAIILSEMKGVTKEEFSLYHHSGYCGAAARGDNVIY